MSTPIILDPANSPQQPGDPKRNYGPSLKDPATGKFFYGCDQQKTLGTIRLNPDRLDKYEMRLSGTCASFYLDGNLFWTTKSGIHDFVDQLIKKEIALIKNKMTVEANKNQEGSPFIPSQEEVLEACACVETKNIKFVLDLIESNNSDKAFHPEWRQIVENEIMPLLVSKSHA